jgi:hypothetical protein
MTNEEIAEKYGIEPIMKEMWVWDSPKIIEKQFVIGHVPKDEYGFLTIKDKYVVNFHTYASETNPNEPKVGDKGYFWDDERYYTYDLLNNIIDTHGISSIGGFRSSFCGSFVNFSHEKQPWMK